MDDLDLAVLGLAAAWLVNDTEELCTMAATPTRPFLATGARGSRLSQQYVNTAVGLMGTAVAAVTTAGLATRGRSAVFRGTVLAFGLHGFGHLALSFRAGRYTTGLVTGITVVLPYWFWARTVLARHGLSDHDLRAVLVAATLPPAALLAVHRAGYRILGADGSVDHTNIRAGR